MSFDLNTTTFKKFWIITSSGSYPQTGALSLDGNKGDINLFPKSRNPPKHEADDMKNAFYQFFEDHQTEIKSLLKQKTNSMFDDHVISKCGKKWLNASFYDDKWERYPFDTFHP